MAGGKLPDVKYSSAEDAGRDQMTSGCQICLRPSLSRTAIIYQEASVSRVKSKSFVEVSLELRACVQSLGLAKTGFEGV